MHTRWRGSAALVAIVICLMLAPGRALSNDFNYGFAAAAEEITQLFWLADTAGVCQWASAEEVEKFKSFSVRFLGAHLVDAEKAALLSLIAANDYAGAVRRTAQQGVDDAHNCDSERWRNGWLTYKAAADQREADY